MKTVSPVREQLLEHTLVLLGTRGYNGFSYRDLAELVGVKTSSIHYYFPTKEDLALAAVQAYAANIGEIMRDMDINGPLKEQIEKYLALWRKNLGTGRVCLCGMLAAEATSLPENVLAALQTFYCMHEAWITRRLERVVAEKGAQLPAPPAAYAMTILGALQSGLVSARLFGKPDRLDAASAMLRSAIGADSSKQTAPVAAVAWSD
ncbi:bacterial regulatory s, tetR family protein [Collimonas arenae]|uniref:Bacterial regulatory s, tetR family protein n=1 Tax=Collimonas arenae TaxID=279058 RepID=A0A127QE45_9BURK|nr:TetR/AcrR family transcriptional regulator [Collimonas arenae]AMO98019.1 bacterial regulatory s, tetR family protein [Collimonas arenae]AMP07882.1 bacterial regulatory s, tetR family protein [Collimonas arenae]